MDKNRLHDIALKRLKFPTFKRNFPAINYKLFKIKLTFLAAVKLKLGEIENIFGGGRLFIDGRYK